MRTSVLAIILALAGCSGSIPQDVTAEDALARCRTRGYTAISPDDDQDGDELGHWKCVMAGDGGTTADLAPTAPPPDLAPPPPAPDLATAPSPDLAMAPSPDLAMAPSPDLAPPPDTTPPTFAGASSATASGSTITLSWSAASDNVTPASQIVYLVYQATTSGGESFATPSHTTAAGATSYAVSGLAASTTYYFVVRARDAAGNIDANTKQVSATTAAPAISFSGQVQPIFTAHCTGCHSGGQFPNLSAGQSYGQLVNVASQICSTAKEVVAGQPAQSFLVTSLTSGGTLGTCSGGFMSSFIQAADLSTLSTWIAQGAPNN